MENKGKGSIIIIILFGLIILGLIGYICYDKGVFGKKESSENNNTENKTDISEKKQDYDKDKAKELVDLYYFEIRPGENLFTVSIDDRTKKTISIKHLENEIRTIDCSQIEGFENTGNGCVKNGVYTKGSVIDYDVLNKEYKFLFGKSNELSKESFKHLNNIETWEYLTDKNVYLYTYIITGIIGGPSYTTYAIKDFSQNDDKLTVDVGYVFMKGDLNEDDPVLETTISGEKVSYKLSETQKEGFEQEFKDKYLDKLDTYQFTFKYEDDHYVFVDMKKI